MLIKYLPWHKLEWERLEAQFERFPHALLLHGRPGTGKLHLANVLAQSLLCEHRANERLACGRCAACLWFASGNHPDFRLIQPESMASGTAEDDETAETTEEGRKKLSKQIKIEQIRALGDFLNLGSHRSGHRVVLICPAEVMNAGAANALLKSLEEPAAGVIFLLVSHQPSRLPATVRSRCQSVSMGLPPKEESLRWLRDQGSKAPESELAFAGEAPLEAIAQAEEETQARSKLFELLSHPASGALELSEFCQRLPPAIVVNWMLKWTYDLVMLARERKPRYNLGLEAKLSQIASSMPTLELLRFYQSLCSLRAIAEHPLNARLFFDDLFIAYKEIA